MGVPGFFLWIVKNFDVKLHLKQLDKKIDYLFLDGNSCLHRIGFENKDLEDDKLINLMIKDLKEKCFLLESKNKYIYLDGIAPLGKIKNQRNRRYKKYYDEEIYQKVYQKYDKKYQPQWDNTVLSPGTQFMKKLINKSKKYFEDINFEGTKFGEGEHKIFDKIRSLKDKKNIVIMGDDADLIFLSLIHNQHNIYILRNEKEKNKYFLIDINYLREEIIMLLPQAKYLLENKFKIKKFKNKDSEIKRCINDFTFILFFLGNDFLPKLPNFDIYKGGIQILLEYYNKYYSINENTDKFLITPEIELNKYNFSKFIELINFDKNSLNIKYNYPSKKIKSDTLENELTNIENVNYNNFYNITNFTIFNKTTYIQISKYYQIIFNYRKYQDHFIEKICHNYLDTMRWVIKYYNGINIDIMHYYQFDYAPYISSLHTHIKRYKEKDLLLSQIESINIDLVSILIFPIFSKNFPLKYKNLKDDYKIKHLFPIKYSILNWNKRHFWECPVNVPFPTQDEINYIKTLIS